jgi:hypothetical protein
MSAIWPVDEAPPTVAEIANRFIYHVHAPRVAALFRHLIEAAEIETDSTARLLGCEPGLDILSRLLLDVKVELLVELALDGSAAKRGAKTIKQVRQHHAPPLLMSMTRPTAAVSFRQLSVCAASCFRPLGRQRVVLGAAIVVRVPIRA